MREVRHRMWFLVPNLLERFVRDQPYRPPRPQWRRRRRKSRAFQIGIAMTGLVIGVLAGLVYFDQHDSEAKVPPQGFRTCAEAKRAGVGQMWFWHKGYRPELDADHDGRACEWNGGIFR